MLRLRSTDIDLVEQQLRAKVAKLPSLFLDAPVLVDLSGLGDEASSLALDDLVRALRACKLVPVAAANIPDELRGAVAAAGLGVWRPPVAPRGRTSDESEPAETTAPEPARPSTTPAALPSALARPPHTGPVVVTKPVRGGQVIHARDNDLVVLAPVNPGAQVIADGHLHIYATLRGRAVAGAGGLAGRAHLLSEAGSRAGGDRQRLRDGRGDPGRAARSRRADLPRGRRMPDHRAVDEANDRVGGAKLCSAEPIDREEVGNRHKKFGGVVERPFNGTQAAARQVAA